jgi:hypothetical protein
MPVNELENPLAALLDLGLKRAHGAILTPPLRFGKGDPMAGPAQFLFAVEPPSRSRCVLDLWLKKNDLRAGAQSEVAWNRCASDSAREKNRIFTPPLPVLSAK